jgi:hypothetical protein
MDLGIYFLYRLCFEDNLNLGHILVYSPDKDHHDIREDKYKYRFGTERWVHKVKDCKDRRELVLWLKFKFGKIMEYCKRQKAYEEVLGNNL